MVARQVGSREEQRDLERRPALLVITTVPATIRGFLLPFARRMRELGWVVSAASSGITATALEGEFDRMDDLPLSRRFLDVQNVVRGVPAVRRLVQLTRPDIVHVHTPIAAAVVRIAIRSMPQDARPAVAYTAHGFHFYAGGGAGANLVFQTLERLLSRWTDRLVVINDEDEQAALRLHLVPRSRLVRMPGIGIDTAFYVRSQVQPEQADGVRRQIGIGNWTPLFASVAELSARKCHEKTIEAIARMRHGDAHLVIAGDGGRRAALESLAARLGVADRIHFVGLLTDVRPLLLASTGFILASRQEGLARSVMEALSLEVPAVVSDARGNAELVGADGGVVVPHGEPAGLADAMDRLAGSPDLGREMGRRGRARIAARYGLAPVIEMHERMYAGMLADRVGIGSRSAGAA